MNRLKKEYIEQEWLPDWDFLCRHAQRLLEHRDIDVRYVSDEDANNVLLMMNDISQKVGRQVLGEPPDHT